MSMTAIIERLEDGRMCLEYGTRTVVSRQTSGVMMAIGGLSLHTLRPILVRRTPYTHWMVG